MFIFHAFIAAIRLMQSLCQGVLQPAYLHIELFKIAVFNELHFFYAIFSHNTREK